MATSFELLTQELKKVPAPFRLRYYLTQRPHAPSAEVIKALERVGTRVNVRMVEFVRQFLPPHDSETMPILVAS